MENTHKNRTKLPKPGISVKILDLKTNKSITYSSYREATLTESGQKPPPLKPYKTKGSQ